ncbi:MotA/TolQ/ExbB proton channel family protein [Vallitalea pronyensis]|uniref:MotA/TolQ/ExbB proton channel family protein n=1 Tax=Vallitalea pronyensis TaxID=1348613 RepID=A0A8J8SHA5_9FIRM|nr:MotA/TolQ/ExbB proton channel family protein [Vallitalea pronyensis]QUI23234.1 MotA/TolQ/ExbB proton channel family protein [Vallitalea pronyensis]
MDLATIGGLIAGVFFIVAAILQDKGNLADFGQLASVMITFGGTFSATLISFPLADFINSVKSVTLIFRNKQLNEGEIIRKIIELSNIARKEGLLALEEAAESIDDEFMKKGILLIVDGTDPELVRNILETEIIFVEGRHKYVQGFWNKVGEYGPAWGMIGTLIGLIKMLQNMNDPSTIGPSMSVALLTTLYGSVLANFLALPIANKMKVISEAEILLKEVAIEGLLSIQAGENPRVIEEKLKAFLAPRLRDEISEDDAQEGENNA